MSKNPSKLSFRNYDAPSSKLEKNQEYFPLRKKHGYDLGLEIFELKKEMGLALNSHRVKNPPL